MGLELNMIRFMGILLLFKDFSELRGVKYFVIQASGSALMLTGRLLRYLLPPGGLVSGLVRIRATLKLGAAPAHRWLVSVMSKLRWGPLFLLSTTQKVLPLLVLSQVGGGLVTKAVVIACLAIRSAGALRQVVIKKLLAYSSIFSLS